MAPEVAALVAIIKKAPPAELVAALARLMAAGKISASVAQRLYGLARGSMEAS